MGTKRQIVGSQANSSTYRGIRDLTWLAETMSEEGAREGGRANNIRWSFLDMGL